MAKKKTKLTTEEINELVAAHKIMKRAERIFKEVKERLCADLPDGVFSTEEGEVVMKTYLSTSTDYKAFITDNPKLKPKLEKYAKQIEKTSTTIRSN